MKNITLSHITTSFENLGKLDAFECCLNQYLVENRPILSKDVFPATFWRLSQCIAAWFGLHGRWFPIIIEYVVGEWLVG